jgi:phenylacetate-CoA ligase
VESYEAIQVNELIHGRLVYPGILRLIGESEMFSELERLKSLQYESGEEVRRAQLERLAQLLNYTARTSPIYESLLRSASPITGANSLDVLRTLPMLTKQTLQDELDQLMAVPQPGRTSLKTTGGSTGQPVTVVKDAGATARERAATWLAYGWFGVRPGDRGARFWGSPRAVGKRRMRFALADAAMNRIRFSAFGFTEGELEAYWQRCLRFKPRYFYGYVSMLEAFARFVRESGKDGSTLGLKAVITTSEVLTESQRELIGETFRVPVQNEYGCGEVGPIAYECEAGSMHVMSENVFVELLDESGNPVSPGHEGEIVVTDLHNKALPLLRYRIRDYAFRLDECACARGFPVLGSIRGRAYDTITAPSGRSYHGEFFMYLFEDLRDAGGRFERFKIIQTGSSALDVEIQTRDMQDAALVATVQEQLKRELPDMQIDVRLVNEIELSGSGKHRLVENRIGRGS